ncbi:hypothetical protein D3C81_1163460 [compost metagenome]
MAWFAIALDIAGAGKYLRAQAAQFACDQVGVGQWPDAQRQIGFAGDQVQLLVAQVHVHADFRVLRLELTQQRGDPHRAHGVGHGEAQPAARAGLQLAHRALGLLQFAGNALAMFVIDRAGFGQAEAAGGAIQQACAEPAFQLLHLAADRGLGLPEQAGGCGEASLFDHLHEDQGVIEIVGHWGAL